MNILNTDLPKLLVACFLLTTSCSSSSPTDPTDPTGGNNTNTSTTLTSVSAKDKSSFTLSSIKSNGNTLVTMGIPFKPGVLTNTDRLRIVDATDTELSLFVKPTIFWHSLSSPDNTIRAVKVQFYMDMNTGDEITLRWVVDSSRDIAKDLTEQPVEDSQYQVNNADRTGVYLPKIMVTHNVYGLAESQIIPPYLPEQNDTHKDYIDSQFSWAKELEYNRSSFANWLFDRTTSVYKICMRNGDIECYKEAIQSYYYWTQYIVKEGEPTAAGGCAGGVEFPNTTDAFKLCDTKYLYIEPIKIHAALTGDDRILADEELIYKMSQLAEEPYYQGDQTDAYDDPSDSFTERAAGLPLLAQISAYEILQKASYRETLKNQINTRINVLSDMQKNNIDNYANDGTLRHSWSVHEGNPYPGNTENDRRFSPWMTENSVDALWHAYQVMDNENISSLLSGLAQGVLNWGFADSPGYLTKFGDNLHDLPNGTGWTNGCSNEVNGYKPIVLYSGSSLSDSASLITTQSSEGWYSDSHNPEVILILALGLMFDDNASNQSAYHRKILDISSSYFTQACGASSSTKRKFNWNNRGNAWGTYLYAKDTLRLG